LKQSFLYNLLLLIADGLIFCLCCGGLYLITLKADLPFKTSTENSKIFISKNPSNYKNLNPGDELLSVDSNQFSKWEEIEFYLDGKNIGDSVPLQIKREGKIFSANVELTNYYCLSDLIIIAVVGLIFLVMGIFVRVRAPDNSSAQLFHWASVGLGMVIVITAGNYSFSTMHFGLINRIIWLVAYSFTPVLFIHFTSSFSNKKIKGNNNILFFFYLIALINSAVLAYLFLDATLGGNEFSLKYYVEFFDSFFRVFLIICILIAISICIYAYRSANDLEERKRLQWLLLGFFIGPFSFVVLWVIPILLTGYSIIPESIILIFLVSIPLTFSVAIIKYHLMNINLIIRRSVLYTIVLALIILIYVGVSSFITLFVRDTNPAIPSVITAVAVLFLLQPLKNSVQKFIDKKFFRMEYDYRKEQNKFLEEIKNIYDDHSLAELIVKRVDKLIPVEKLGYFELNNQTGRIGIISSKGWDVLKGRSIRFEFENLKSDLSLPIAVDNKVEYGIKVEAANIKVFKRWGMVLVIPVKSPSGLIHGFLVMGEKKSGIRFLKDDVDLLNSIVFAIALAIDRIKLQKDLILEQLETEKQKELNQMKSFFMQTITHELKTPLTSIKMFTQKLQDKKDIPPDKAEFFLNVIDGESDKLRRLVDNILDYARIEKGLKTYHLECADLVTISRKAVDSMKYLFTMYNQSLEVSFPEDEIIIYADTEAVERAITNLLTNAVKYSFKGSKTIVSVEDRNGIGCVIIKDSGRGIPADQFKNIFEPFQRVKADELKNIEGTGLGLAIVKHIMDAHKGKIDVQSEVGKGSTITLWFPTTQED
jgi:signal transduction histidine kinase